MICGLIGGAFDFIGQSFNLGEEDYFFALAPLLPLDLFSQLVDVRGIIVQITITVMQY